MELAYFEREIAPKGKAYLVVRDGPAEALAAAYYQMRAKGARQVFAASKNPNIVLQEGPLGNVRLQFAHDMLGLTCRLGGERPRPCGLLTLEPLTREKKDLYLRIYNESFFDVPNSETYDEESFEQLMGPEYRCGFALMDGAPMGIYELGFKKENPELGSIGLAGAARGKGLGRELLLTLLDYLAELGCGACWLQVSTGNAAAYSLYRSVGFGEDERLGRWYEVVENDG